MALDKLKNDEGVIGFVSAGSTGAVLTGSFLKVGRVEGVSRPALMPILPTKTGGVVGLIDCGANMDSKPINLCHFAAMGSAFMECMYGVKSPRVALLNVGTEKGKGNELTKETFDMLSDMPINFVGNIEARELMSGQADLFVCDGFSGNVLLKSSEGAVLAVMSMLKDSIMSDFKSKIGALLMKKTFKNLKQKIDYSSYGGAPFLGVKKIVIKSHGSSKAESICASVMQVIKLAEKDLITAIKTMVDGADKALKGKVQE